MVASTGAPGFFEPRVPPAVVMPPGTLEAIGLYDTSPLRETLLELVDFDLLNSGATRVSVGAVQLKTGNMKYFDTAHGQRIGPEHVMGSGALPPGFPPIDIDDEPYWDGGLVSNTPLQFVLEKAGPREDMVIFQIDLFSAKGPVPQNLFEIAQRERRPFEQRQTFSRRPGVQRLYGPQSLAPVEADGTECIGGGELFDRRGRKP